MTEQHLFTRYAYLVARTVAAGTDPLTAIEVVSSVALAHPEWDLNESRTWDEWVYDVAHPTVDYYERKPR